MKVTFSQLLMTGKKWTTGREWDTGTCPWAVARPWQSTVWHWDVWRVATPFLRIIEMYYHWLYNRLFCGITYGKHHENLTSVAHRFSNVSFDFRFYYQNSTAIVLSYYIIFNSDYHLYHRLTHTDRRQTLTDHSDSVKYDNCWVIWWRMIVIC